MKLNYHYCSEIGTRSANEDCLGICKTQNGIAFAMADGAGKMPYGALASKVAVWTYLEIVSKEQESKQLNLDAYSFVDQILAKTRDDKGYPCEELKTTLASLQLDLTNESFYVSHQGDSRVYVFRKGELFFQTKDHSKAVQLIEQGKMKASELRSCEEKHYLTSILGRYSLQEIQENEGILPGSEASEAYVLMEGMAFLICTDGFWNEITEARMVECLQHADSAEQWLFLMKRFVEHSGKQKSFLDNYSAITVMVS